MQSIRLPGNKGSTGPGVSIFSVGHSIGDGRPLVKTRQARQTGPFFLAWNIRPGYFKLLGFKEINPGPAHLPPDGSMPIETGFGQKDSAPALNRAAPSVDQDS